MTSWRPLMSRLEMPATPLTSTALVEWLGGTMLDAGVPVTPTSSLGMSAVWRSVTLVSGVSAALPLHSYARGTKRRTENALLADPHPELTDLEVWRLSHAHRLLWGESCIQKVRNGAGQITQLWPITPHRVLDIRRGKPTPDNPGGKLFQIVDDDGKVHELTTRHILHIPGFSYDGVRGVSAIGASAQGIGLALAAERSAARFFGKGAQLSGVLETDQDLEQGKADALKERWQAKLGGVDAAHEIAVLDNGAKFRPLTMPYRDAQLLESRQFQIEEIGRYFGVPHFLLGLTQKSTSWGTGLEQQALGWVQFDLAPQSLTPVERRITKELLPAGEYAKFTVEGLLRGDSKSRAEFFRVMRELGVYNADEIRDLDDREPIPGGAGEIYWQPANMQVLGATPEEPPAPPGDDDEELDDDV